MFYTLSIVKTVQMQGDPGNLNWVKTYRLMSSEDCTSFIDVLDGLGSIKVNSELFRLCRCIVGRREKLC